MDVALAGYRAALNELFARTTGASRLGLERTAALLARIGHPERRLRALHIAGTNGKGSVAATLDAVLRAQGWKVGTYTSPHLVEFTERLLIDGRPIEAARVADWIGRRMPDVIATDATFFEATTAMAFELFVESDVDLAVIETGLGGRLDATNVMTPLVAGVTSIGIDHTEYLGDTRELIAAEKAGIFKPGIPAIIGDRDPDIIALLGEYARHAGAEPVCIIARRWAIEDVRVGRWGTSFVLRDNREESREWKVRTPLAGVHQASNCATALGMLQMLPESWRVSLDDAISALDGVRLPGRFQRHGRWIFDVAHNRDGARVLAETLGSMNVPRPVTAVVCVLGDKDWRGMLEELWPVVDELVLTQAPTAPASRMWNPAEAGAYASSRGWKASVAPDFGRALATVEQEGGTVLVTGSFHTAGDAMAWLKLTPYGG